MRYSMFAGGKRLRPALVLECCRVAGGEPLAGIAAACAAEMIHTYSLIHDDLPAMDDDDLRRGRPSCHRAFDEATAILAGDALLALAFETAAGGGRATALEVVTTFARAAGPGCLVGGQMLDMAAEGAHVTLADVEAIHDHKTADLLAACCRAGAVVGRGRVDDRVEALERYGRNLGRAFQVADDILDVTSSAEDLGKTPGKDAAAGKATYPALAGLDRARARAAELRDEAVAALAEFAEAARGLGDLARFVVERSS
jgi:geranylgeranyl pyrophosphate synthase